MPKVDLDRLPRQTGAGRLSPLLGSLGAYEGASLADGFPLTGLGASVELLAPGSASSHRHWHEKVDEIVVVLEGRLTLLEEEAETALLPGDIAVFPAGIANGHCLRNDGDLPARFFVVSSKDAADRCHYVDAGLVAEPDGSLCREDGSPISLPEDAP